MAISHVFTPALGTASSSASKTLAYTSSVLAAGDVLWCFTWQNNATDTCTGVSDGVNGSWTAAPGFPIRGDANNSNASLYAFYKLNSAGGNPTVTASWSATGTGGIFIGAIRGLAGGGALDQAKYAKVNGVQTDGWPLATDTLTQAAEAGIGCYITSNLGTYTARWTEDKNIDSSWYERTQRTITSSTSPTTFGTAGAVLGGGTTATMGLMMFMDVPSSLASGNFSLEDFVLSGTFATGALSQLAGGISLDAFINAGVLGLAPGIVTTQPFKNWSGTLLPGVTVPNVVFLKLDRSTALSLASQTTGGDAVMVISNASLVAGTYYIMVSFNTDGSSIGAELVLAS